MVKLGDLLETMNIIETKTLRQPTHILVSEQTADNLVTQYNELANSDADMVYQYGEKTYTIEDVGGFLGVTIVLSVDKKDGFKILEEVTSNS